MILFCRAEKQIIRRAKGFSLSPMMHAGAPLMVANLLVRHNWVVGAKSPWGSWTPAEMGLRAELCTSVRVCWCAIGLFKAFSAVILHNEDHRLPPFSVSLLSEHRLLPACNGINCTCMCVCMCAGIEKVSLCKWGGVGGQGNLQSRRLVEQFYAT